MKHWIILLMLSIFSCAQTIDQKYPVGHNFYTDFEQSSAPISLQNPPLSGTSTYDLIAHNNFKEEIRTHFTDLGVEQWRLITTAEKWDTLANTHQDLYYSFNPNNASSSQSSPSTSQQQSTSSSEASQTPQRTSRIETSVEVFQTEPQYYQDPFPVQVTEYNISKHMAYIAGIYHGYATSMYEITSPKGIVVYYFYPRTNTSDEYFIPAGTPGYDDFLPRAREEDAYRLKLKQERQAKELADQKKAEQEKTQREQQAIEFAKQDREQRALQIYGSISFVLGDISKELREQIIHDVLTNKDQQASYLTQLMYQTVQESIEQAQINQSGVMHQFADHPYAKYCPYMNATSYKQQVQMNYLLACTQLQGQLVQTYAYQGLVDYAYAQRMQDPQLQPAFDAHMAELINRMQNHIPLPELTEKLPQALDERIENDWRNEALYLDDLASEDELQPHEVAKQQRLQDRLKARAQTEQDPTITNKQYDLDHESAGYLLAQGYNYKNFIAFEGNELQHQFHQEQIEQVGIIKDFCKNERYQQNFSSITQLINEYIAVSHAFNSTNNVNATAATNDATFAWYDYMGAVVKGSACGLACSAVLSVPAFAVTAQTLFVATIGCATLYVTYHLAQLAHGFAHNLVFEDPSYQEKALTELTDIYTKLKKSVKEYCKDGITPNVVEDATDMTMSFLVPPARAASLIKSSCIATLLFLEESAFLIRNNPAQLPAYVLRTAGVAVQTAKQAPMLLMDKAKQTAKQLYTAGTNLAKRIYHSWPKVKPIEIYQDLTYLQKVLSQMKDIRQLEDFIEATSNFTDFSKLSEVQLRALELYAWFYENGFKEMINQLEHLSLSLPFQGKNIAIAKEWPLFHSFIGEVPAAWNRVAKPSGGHYNFYDFMKKVWEFGEIKEQALNFIKAQKRFPGKNSYTPTSCVSTVHHHPLKEFAKIVQTLQNPKSITWFKNTEKINEFLCHIKGPYETIYAYTFKLEQQEGIKLLKLATFYEIKSFGMSGAKKWTNM